MADQGDRLLALARTWFTGLTPADERLLTHAVAGTVADFGGPSHEEVDGEWLLPWDESDWSAGQTVRVDVLRWLCTDPDASRLVDLRGVRVRGAFLAERVDLAYASVPFPLELTSCACPNGIDMQAATIKVLSLAGSRCRDLNAEYAELGGDLSLSDNFRAEGRVSLAGANIGGQMVCTDANFSNPGGHALHGDSMTVKGGVILSPGFQAEGTMWLADAEIGGLLDCTEATFTNPGGDALFGESMTVKADVFLRQGFRAKGMLWLHSAAIGGSLDCNGATFCNPGGYALVGQLMTVKESVLLRQGFRAEGRVSLGGVEIRRGLDCSNGSFTGLDLRSATVGMLADDSNTSWPDDGELWLDGLTYRSIGLVPGGSITREAWIIDRLRWIRRQPGYAPQPYAELRDFLHRVGYEAEARTVAIARQTDLRKLGSLPRPARLWNWFLGLTIAHGYEPWRPVAFGILIIVLGYVVFRDAHAAGLLVADEDGPAPTFNAFIYSLDTFLPIVDFRMQDKWVPTGEGTVLWYIPVQWFYWGTIAFGWIISTLFVLSFTRLVRQD
jgi:hypothetical protein